MNQYSTDISHLVPENKLLDERTRKQCIKRIHTEHVSKVISEYPNNKVLDDKPPEINKSELGLPRQARTKLSQLRSGYCPLLNSYLHSIGQSDTDICPDCRTAPQDTAHIFSCPANPTELQTIDLWENPLAVANFLDLQTNEGEEDTEIEPG